MIVEPALVTAALLQLLRDTGVAVGDHETPNGYPKADEGHAELFHIDGGGFDGPPYVAPEADATLVYQVSAVGWRRDQAEMVAGRLRAAVLDRDGTGAHVVPLAVPGWAVQGRVPDGIVAGVERQGDQWIAADRYRITVTPL